MLFVREVRDIRRYQYVLSQLVRQQLTLRYRRTALGYVWTLLNPILMMSVMAVVFSTLFGQDIQTFAVFLFSGMIAWNCFNAIVGQSGASFINNEGLIKKIYIPKIVFPLSVSIASLIDSVLSFVALFAIILAIGGKLSWALFFIPFAFLALFVFSAGIALLVAVATVFFRDLQYVIGIMLQALFFLTPVFYKPDSLAGKVSWLIWLNPVAYYVELFRAPLHVGVLPDANVIGTACLLAVVSIVVGVVVFRRNEKKIVFRL